MVDQASSNDSDLVTTQKKSSYENNNDGHYEDSKNSPDGGDCEACFDVDDVVCVVPNDGEPSCGGPGCGLGRRMATAEVDFEFTIDAAAEAKRFHNIMVQKEEAAADELQAVLARMVETEGPGRRRAALLEKAREQELDPAEKEELRVLLERRSGGTGNQREAG